MAGHSKWANIKHRKARVDAVRGKLFSRLIKEITVAARQGGGDPDANPRLRLAVDKAKSANLPNDNLVRAIKRGTGDLEGVNYEDRTYEGYGPAGVAFVVECLTDNTNRTVAEIRNIFGKCGGNLGTDGSVAWMFALKGQIVVAAEGVDEDEFMMTALDAGAEDVEVDDDFFSVTCAPSEFQGLCAALTEAGYAFDGAEVTKLPQTTKKIAGGAGKNVVRLWELLDDHDDVQSVYHNLEFDAALMDG
jgi:YebC/PmpR family DNA-binding regulatory protein